LAASCLSAAVLACSADKGRPSRDGDTNFGSDGKDCVDVNPVYADQTPDVLASGIGVGFGMRGLVLQGTTLFFVTDESRIMRIEIAGSTPEEVAVEAVRTRGLTAIGDDLYWEAGDYDEGLLRRMPASGGEVKSLGRARSFYNIEKLIAFDDTHVYWTDFDIDGQSCEGRIMSIARAGGTATPLVDHRPGIPFSVATDGSEVFWTEGVTVATRIVAVSREGGELREIAQLDAGAGDLAIDGRNLYFGTTESDAASAGVYRVSKAGGTPRRVVRTGFTSALRITLDDTHIYWGADHITKAAKDGCEVTDLMGVNGACEGIAADATSIYYVTGNMGGDTGLVLRLHK
jgi:hypothetical protein